MTVPSLTRFKVCTKCGCTKPATREWFYVYQRGIHGLMSSCKVCRSVFSHRWRKENKENIRQRRKENGKRIRERERRYYKENRERIREQQRRWREKNKERLPGLHRHYYEKNKEQINERKRRWAEENREACRVRTLRYVARKRTQQGEPYAGEDIRRLYEEQDGCCYYCSVELDKYHIEHMTPISRGGLDCLHNIVLACPTCNLRKGAKTAEEFFEALAKKDREAV